MNTVAGVPSKKRVRYREFREKKGRRYKRLLFGGSPRRGSRKC